MKYHFIIHKEKKGYWAECMELKGCMSQGNSLDELKFNLKEALDLYLDEPEDSKIVFPLPHKSAREHNCMAIEVDPVIALSFLVRRERLKRKWTQQMAAKELGVPLYSYQKLESSKTANPQWKTLVKLHKIFPSINFNEAAGYGEII